MEIYLTVAELAGMVKLSGQTIRRYVLNKTIPYHKIQRRSDSGFRKLKRGLTAAAFPAKAVEPVFPLAICLGKRKAEPLPEGGHLKARNSGRGKGNPMSNLLFLQNLAVWPGHFSGNLPNNNPERLYGFACIDRKIAGDNG